MKVLFFCGSLEPGRDGVGDYTRRLAKEIIQQGHRARIIALNDAHITATVGGVQPEEGLEIKVLRLARTVTDEEKLRKIKNYITDFEPDWLSLQFVPFAFHPKGLPTKLAALLNEVGQDRKWHIMFHELWVGMDKESPFKHVLWGWLQKRIINNIIKKLAPAIITTQTQLYIKMLSKLGYNASHLPLFGNIPVNKTAKVEKNGKLSFVIFGGIHHSAPVSALAKEIAAYSSSNQVPVELKLLGRCGAEQKNWEEAFNAEGVNVKTLGEQPTERISQELYNASYGISTTPALLIEKSGSVAAMRQHGLPVLCISRSWRPRGVNNIELPPDIKEYQPGELSSFIQNKPAATSANDAAATATLLLNLFSSK